MSDVGFGTRLWNKVKSIGQTPEYNILLLGETGTGKSTTINAWANYVRFSAFDEAKSNEFEGLIPAKFKLPHPTTQLPIEINCGLEGEESRNESFNDEGASVTQLPSAYTFRFKDKVLRIIDTPGIGDTRGANVDSENFDNIMAHLHNYSQLHAIVILFKANQTRSTASFRFCITELLNHLHKDASKNIIFCFTFSQNSNFRPGDGHKTVKAFLKKELPEVEIELKCGENCFFIDNEAFRYLAALKEGYQFDSRQERGNRISWEKSAEQSSKMWDRITRHGKPHKLMDTISLNNARKFILEMAEPLVRLQTVIEANIAHIRAHEGLLSRQTQTKADLEEQLNIEVDFLESEPLDYPRTVCTEQKCVELINYQGNVQVHFKTICHSHCYLDGVGVNRPGHELLRHCAAMLFGGTCMVCRCRWEKHQHITVRFKKVKVPALDQNIKNQIMSAESTIDGIKGAIQALDDKIDSLREEYDVIQDICSKFAYILIKYSTTRFNRFIEPYLDLQMDEERMKIQANQAYPKDTLNSLQKMKETHIEKVEIIKRAMESSTEEKIELKDIYLFKDKLLSLKFSGEQLRQMLQTASWSQKVEVEQIQEKGLNLTETTMPTPAAATAVAAAAASSTLPSPTNDNNQNSNNSSNKESFWSTLWSW